MAADETSLRRPRFACSRCAGAELPGRRYPSAGSRPPRRPDAPMRWYKGNTHTHTLNSDGDSTPDDVVRWYREHGYQFLVLTDHNFVTSVDGLNALHGADERFLVIRGEEVTSRSGDKPIHVNGLDVERRVEPPRAVLRRRGPAARGRRDPKRIGRAAHQPSELRVGDHRSGTAAGPQQPALRDLQRAPAGQPGGRRRRARTGRGVGSDPLERHAAVRDRRGRCPRLQAAGESARVRGLAAAG